MKFKSETCQSFMGKKVRFFVDGVYETDDKDEIEVLKNIKGVEVDKPKKEKK